MFMRHARAACALLVILSCCLIATAAFAQAPIAPELQQKIDKIAADTLAKTGVPSASVAVVKDGHVLYTRAYGNAHLEPGVAATPQMRYSIGSISKQFTAAAILLLAEQHKLSLDDKVGKYIPNLTRGNDITIRQVLSHTAGYQDYWPQDYVMPMMLKPVTAEKILDGWARKPLDFEPGAKWQYSNTGFVVAGAIVEKVSGKPLFQFLTEKIFAPLGMKSVTDQDQTKLTEPDPQGYIRYALGPARPAPKEGAGWMYAAGELAMTAEDLARWDVAMIEQKILKPESFREMEEVVLLTSGLPSGYGLGVTIDSRDGHRAISHGGEVSGFTAENVVLPDDGAAVVVLTNQDAASASGGIANAIVPLLVAGKADAEADSRTAQAKAIFEGLQKGTIDRTLFTDNCNFYFSEQALKDFAASLGPLGAPQTFTQRRTTLRGGMRMRLFLAKFGDRTLRVWTYQMPDGKLEQYMVAAIE